MNVVCSQHPTRMQMGKVDPFRPRLYLRSSTLVAIVDGDDLSSEPQFIAVPNGFFLSGLQRDFPRQPGERIVDRNSLRQLLGSPVVGLGFNCSPHSIRDTQLNGFALVVFNCKLSFNRHLIVVVVVPPLDIAHLLV